MKASIFAVLTSLFLFHIQYALSWPGMTTTLKDVMSMGKRQTNNDGDEPKELIGDLLTLSDSQLTPVAADIKSILLGTGSAESSTIDTTITPPLGSKACAADTCCAYKWLSLAMIKKFAGSSGRCTRFARAAVRLGFHDAGAWSKTSAFGGADGSILLTNELDRVDNKGLQDIAAVTKAWYKQYQPYGISMADMIQFGATVATVVCPLGPRIKSYVGRIDNPKANPEGLLPGVNDSADKLIDMFRQKTIDPHGLVALVGAHTTSQQHFVNISRDGDPQDSTPGVWDVKFYGETLQPNPPVRVFKFASDVALSKDPRASSEWNEFVNGQSHWNEDYAQEYVRLSLLGVKNINSLKECTKVLPPAKKSYTAPDQLYLTLWLSGKYPQLGKYIDDAQSLLELVGSILPILKNVLGGRI
ncbi:heme peroxidase [Pseudovirgaria hyperparasitica]|uniref:Peroxidase n=1 Tax=Pseudovirgaria hyperparasitica TaxID=470096 RepID=A0A6A6W688_9PEZI|nr:heme peroxidase [Pseudovirgaria hyperparasitica]KAF2758133.1 heme peroxidase [Pseudovirgaria hyperparasitica]